MERCRAACLWTLLLIAIISPYVVTAATCPAGFDCASRYCNASQVIDCGPGYYCPGFAEPRRCRQGFYCPSAVSGEIPQELPCPVGHFCPLGYARPISCPATYICPEGSSRHFFFGGVIIFVLGGLFLYSVNRFFQFLDAKNRHVAMYAGYQRLPIVDPKLRRAYTVAVDTQKKFMIDLGFENVSVQLKGKTLLSGVTGVFKAGQVHAIMGPTQVGKTVLMNVLANKMKHTEGKVFINGKEGVLSDYKDMVAFVPQDDIMIRTLTVRETLMFSALARLPKSWATGKKIAQVEGVIDALGLRKVKDSVIGDEERRGVSGGERKRVNIGMELVTDPTVLFLDGPTSGLDSTTAQDLLAVLQRTASIGINIITVLYQPRVEIFNMLNNIMLMGPGGRVAYFGTPEDALPYFESLGFERPQYTNPADFLLDILSGRVQVNKPGTESDLAETWNTKRPTLALPDPSSYPHASEGKKGFLCFGPRKNSEVHRSSPSFFYQLWVFLQRAFLQQRHDFSGVILDSFLHAIAGLVYGIGFASSRFFVPPIPTQYLPYCTPLIDAFCYLPEVDELGRLATFGTMAVGLTAVTMAVRTFSNEKVVYWREAASGENTFSYFLAKCIADIPNMAIGSVVLLSVFFMIAAPHGKFGDYFGAVFLLEFAVYGVGYVCSMIIPTNKDLATLFAATCALIAGLGVNPGGGRELCWGRWFGEAVYIAELRLDVLDPVTRDAVNSFLDFVKRETPSGTYSLDMFGRDLFALAIFGVVLRFLAYLGLRLIYRGRQK
mmetsp:Transcript_28321/g.45883  ORF Transcript_28321/g.45883 Transcript_28321/m.45883 type:complete len:776 (+) Transcript_28321:2-2329(+)